MMMKKHGGMSLPHGVPSRKKPRSGGGGTLFILLLTAVPSFLLGAISTLLLTNFSQRTLSSHPVDHETLEERIREQLETNQQIHVDRLVSEKITRDLESLCASATSRALEDHHENEAVEEESVSLLPLETMGRFAAAMSRVNVHEFAEQYDMGVPIDRGGAGSEELLLIYGNTKTIPKTHGGNLNTIPEMGVAEAVSSCDFLNVVLTDHGNRNQLSLIHI